jgi:hypothetical protein
MTMWRELNPTAKAKLLDRLRNAVPLPPRRPTLQEFRAMDLEEQIRHCLGKCGCCGWESEARRRMGPGPVTRSMLVAEMQREHKRIHEGSERLRRLREQDPEAYRREMHETLCIPTGECSCPKTDEEYRREQHERWCMNHPDILSGARRTCFCGLLETG